MAKESDILVAEISERVREALGEAERRAGEIVSEAEARAREIVAEAERQAGQLRSESEQEARARIDRAREALEELEFNLSGGGAPAAASEPGAAAPEEPEATSPTEPAVKGEPAPAPAPTAGAPTTEELIEQLRGGQGAPRGGGGDGGDGGDSAAARLVAMNMALEGASRDEVESRLADDFDVADREALIDEVFSRVGK